MKIEVLVLSGKEMARKGRPLGHLKTKDYSGTFLNESAQLIIQALEQGPMTFTGIQKKIRLSPSTLTEYLKKLSKIDYVIRSEEDSRIIKLSHKALNPIERALRNLATSSTLVHLDIKRGSELLTDNFVDAILVISTLSTHKFTQIPRTPDCPHPITFECYKERIKDHIKFIEELGKKYYQKGNLFTPPKVELSELLLLKGLARFNHELEIVEVFDKNEDPHLFSIDSLLMQKGFYSNKKELLELLKCGIEDPELFPALGVARQTGTIEQFEVLLEWIRPLIESLEFVEGRKTYHENRVKFYSGRDLGKIPMFEMKHISPFLSKNLAAAVFYQEQTNYYEELFRVWHRKILPPEAQKRMEEMDKKLEVSLAKASKKLRNYPPPSREEKEVKGG